MSDNRALFVEEAITGAIKRLLSGRVNELLGERDLYIPPVEFGEYSGGSAVVPVICFSTCDLYKVEIDQHQ